MNINEYLLKHKYIEHLDKSGYEYRRQTPRLICADGFHVSVQVGENLYCTPRMNDLDYYFEVELGYPSAPMPSLSVYAEEPDTLATVWPYTPVHLVDAMLESHGGIIGAMDELLINALMEIVKAIAASKEKE